jgi:hypothetical protein
MWPGLLDFAREGHGDKRSMRESVAVEVISRPNRAPGGDVWKTYAGEEYIVFVDESFHKFFNFTHEDGNFVHGAVGIPSSRYAEFAGSMASAVDEFRTTFKNAIGTEPKELKSGDLYKLAFGPRRRLLLKLNAALTKNGGVIAGFYTSTIHDRPKKMLR